MINIAKCWLFQNKWCIFVQKHLQAKHNMQILLANDKPINQFWKDRLTDMLIDSVKTVWILQRPRRSTNRTVLKVKKHHL